MESYVPLLAIHYGKPWKDIEKCLISTLDSYKNLKPDEICRSIIKCLSPMIKERGVIDKTIRLIDIYGRSDSDDKSIIMQRFSDHLNIVISDITLEVYEDFLSIRCDWATQHEDFSNLHWERITLHSYDKIPNLTNYKHIVQRLDLLGLSEWKKYTGRQIVKNILYNISLHSPLSS